jgi:hypothetical protein
VGFKFVPLWFAGLFNSVLFYPPPPPPPPLSPQEGVQFLPLWIAEMDYSVLDYPLFHPCHPQEGVQFLPLWVAEGLLSFRLPLFHYFRSQELHYVFIPTCGVAKMALYWTL